MDGSDGNGTLPPGETGWPLVGQTFTFLKDEFHFVSAGAAQHGLVFRTKVLGRDTAVVVGPEGAALFNDESKVQREGGMPPHVEQFFGGKSLPLLDGDVHRTRKALVLSAFTRSALESYVPVMQQRVESWLRRWRERAEIKASVELKRLALEVISANMLSLEPGQDLETILQSFDVLAEGFSALPIPLPGTSFTKSIAARDRIFYILRRVIREHKAKKYDDGLARMLEATAPNGEKLTDEQTLLELHHFNIAGFLVFTMFAAAIVELAKHEDVRQRLDAEIQEHAPSGPLTVAQLMKMPYLDRVVKELKRFTPFVPVFFGKAKTDIDFAGHKIPEGWMILWGHHATNHFRKSFAQPERFDPDRYSPARAEDTKPNAWVPQGVGELAKGHKCAGFDYSTLFMQVFVTLLVRDNTWTLPEQDLSYRYSMVPPEHADGLRVKLAYRAR